MKLISYANTSYFGSENIQVAMELHRNFFEGYGEIIVAAVFWGFAGVLVKKINGMSALSIIFYRIIFAFIILFTVLLLTGNLYKIKLKDKRSYLALFSILQVTTMLTYFISILEASVSAAVLLLYTAPVYVTVLSPVFIEERSTRKGMLALVLSIAGIVLIVGPAELVLSQSVGVIAGILSGISYAFQIMTSKYISKSYSGYSQAFWSFIAAVPVLLLVGMIADIVLRIAPAAQPASILTLLQVDLASTRVISANSMYLILLAIFPTILAVSLYFNGLKKIRASSASILGLIEPLSAVILAVLILNEKISILLILGGALILTGAAIVTRD